MSNCREQKQRRQRERDAALKRPLQSLDLDSETASQRRRRLSREALLATDAEREQWMQERAGQSAPSYEVTDGR